VKLAVSQEGIEISASSPEYGEAKENIEKEYKGDPIAIGFNSSYMLDFLAAAADGPVSIELKDEQSAGQMRPLADESYRYRYIIMPMRIDGEAERRHLLYDDVEVLDFAGPFEVFSRTRLTPGQSLAAARTQLRFKSSLSRKPNRVSARSAI